MEAKLEYLYFNQVWEVIKILKDIKPVGCKWVYKRNKRVDRKVKTYKANLIMKGYSQKPSFDYEKTCSPIAMLLSIKIVLSIATYLDYEIQKMDVKTTFLNDNLEESIYMMQLDGFIVNN